MTGAVDDGDPIALRDTVILEVLYAGGIRVGELCGLDVDDLDLDVTVADSVTVVEWGQGLVEQLADEHLEVRLERRADDVRTVLLVPHGPGWEQRIA